MTGDPHKVGEILDLLEEMAEGRDRVSVQGVMGSFGLRTFGAAIMVPALMEITPVGAVPGVPTFLAAIIALVAVQKLFGRKSLWLPAIVGRRQVDSASLRKSVRKLRGIAGFLDRHFHGRMVWLTGPPFSQVTAGIVLLLCAGVPLLEVLPFASSGPMLAIAIFGLAVLVRDGALMLAALAITLGLAGLALNL